MRRVLLIAALLVLIALPLCAQRRGSGPRFGASVGIRSHSGFGVRHHGGFVIRGPQRGFGFRGGFAFGHNPGFRFSFNRGPFHQRRFFGVNPYYSYYPYYPYYGVPIYPYYPLGYQSDFVYTGTPGQAAYLPEHDSGLQNDVYRLQAELDQMRQEQAERANQQQYVSPSLMQVPRSAQTAKPEPPAPPTVLVFRDGHQDEVHNYAIAGQTLWIFSQERARKVPLADLDLEATRQANEQRGVEFSLRADPAP